MTLIGVASSHSTGRSNCFTMLRIVRNDRCPSMPFSSHIIASPAQRDEAISLKLIRFLFNLYLYTAIFYNHLQPITTITTYINTMEELNLKGEKARKVSYVLTKLSSTEKSKAIEVAADFLIKYSKEIIEANRKDLVGS